MNIDFTKMEGTGNDFVVIDNRCYEFAGDDLAALAQQLCPRRTGVGADGLLAFDDVVDAAADYRMRYLNRDGSVGTMCGNGARCLAMYARHEVGLPGGELRFQSDAGIYRAHVPDDPTGDVRLYVDPPKRFERDVALRSASTAGLEPFHYIWPGVEHAVCFVDEVANAPIERVGRAVRRDEALQPVGANVNFVQVLPENSLQVRTYEKGVEAETPACGTGALAAACVARRFHKIVWPVAVHVPGGHLTVGSEEAGDRITALYLEGPARFVFSGVVRQKTI